MFQLYLLLRLKKFWKNSYRIGYLQNSLPYHLNGGCHHDIVLGRKPFRYSCGMRSLISRLS